MRELKPYIGKWITFGKVKGIKISLADANECVHICESVMHGERPYFINERVKEILDKSGIKTVVEGIGWRVA